MKTDDGSEVLDPRELANQLYLQLEAERDRLKASNKRLVRALMARMDNPDHGELCSRDIEPTERKVMSTDARSILEKWLNRSVDERTSCGAPGEVFAAYEAICKDAAGREEQCAGLRAEVERLRKTLTLRELQEQQKPWIAYNFPGRPSVYPLLGAVEELGELCHAHLKACQGIRGTPEEHRAAKIDAVGDALIFLADYCTAEEIDMQHALEITWAKVQKRDWRKDSRRGGA